ncbi:hypothetical protein U1Q18_013247, partial [Sarracenia purpurea var. burkii]
FENMIFLQNSATCSNQTVGHFDSDDRSDLEFLIKFSILMCFLAAFLLNVQSIRYYSHTDVLINMSSKKTMTMRSLRNHHRSHVLSMEYVGRTMNRGSYFWSLGIRAFYLSFLLFHWIFGTIPRFLCCILMGFLLSFLVLL